MTIPAITATDQIDLVRAELEELAEHVIDPEAREPFGVYLFSSTDAGAELGRAVEREVFAEFFGNSPELLAEEYAPYEPSSLFLVVVDHRRRLPAGVMRVVLPTGAGLKSLDDLETVWGERTDDVLARSRVPYDRSEAWDIATLAVSADYRGAKAEGLVSAALYQALALATLRSPVSWWVTVLDVVVLDLLQSQFQHPFSHFQGIGPKRYLDSPSSVPVWCDIARWEQRIAAADPSTHALLVDGVGLEGAVAQPDWDRLPAVVGTTAGTTASTTADTTAGTTADSPS